MGAAAGRDPGHLGLGVELLGPDPVGPYAGGVDHVVGPDHELGSRSRGRVTVHPGAEVLGRPSWMTCSRLAQIGAEALGLAEHRQHQAGIVGLAVVEQIAAGRAARRRSPAAARSPPRRRSRGAGPGSSRPRRAPGRLRRALRRARSEGAAITSYMFSPIPVSRSGRAPSNAGTTNCSGRTRCGASLTISWRSSSASRTRPEIEVLQVAQAAVDELGRAAARPRGEVGLLDQSDAVSARGGVERHPGAGDPAADDDDVELLAGEGLQRAVAGQHAGAA